MMLKLEQKWARTGTRNNANARTGRDTRARKRNYARAGTRNDARTGTIIEVRKGTRNNAHVGQQEMMHMREQEKTCLTNMVLNRVFHLLVLITVKRLIYYSETYVMLHTLIVSVYTLEIDVP